MISINDVPLDCINQAAIHYIVPAPLIVAVIKTENGRNGMAMKNTNGTYDLGPMQINTSWLPKIARYGYTQHDLQFNACKNVEVGTWILKGELADSGDIWQGVGNYHSHTLDKNANYSKVVEGRYQKILRSIA